jgi:hypothetical protein
MRTLTFIAGWLLVAFSSIFVVGAVGDLVRDREDWSVKVGVGLFFGILGYVGFRLARSRSGPPPLPPPQLLLSIAQRLGGRMTLAEAVLHGRLSVERTRDALKELTRQGLAELHLTEKGEEVYSFSGLVPGDKASARDPLAP